MVGMENENVVGVVNDALAVLVEAARDMDKRANCTRRLKPRLSQNDILQKLCNGFFYNYNLSNTQRGLSRQRQVSYLLCLFAASIIGVHAFLDHGDQVALDGSTIQFTLQ